MALIKVPFTSIALLLCAQNVKSSLLRASLFRSDTPNLDAGAHIVSVDGSNVPEIVNPRMLQAVDTFAPLDCNADPWTCSPWPFGETVSGDVEVPCNVCYSMENYSNGEVIDVSGIIDVKGKLDFPDGTKLTLKTKGVIVQGELAMKSTKVVDGTPDIVVELNGVDDIQFTPDAQNAAACGGADSACNLGPKPFVVAGGKLDISGLPDSCSTWTTVKDIISGGVPEPLTYPQKPTLPDSAEGVCLDELINEDFELGLNKWYGNAGAKESLLTHDDLSGKFLNVAGRTHEYQGPMIDLSPHLRNCLMSDTDYLFTAKIRITPGSDYEGLNSNCHSTKTNCPKLQVSHMDGKGVVRWEELVQTDGAIPITDGEWFTIKQAIKIKIDVDPTDTFSLFSINGVEPGVDIAIDDISIALPPSEAYPDPNTGVCSDLVVNGDAAQLDGYAFPVRSYIKSNLVTVKEENGNPYFSITNRQKYYDSMTVDLNPGCLQSGSIYSFSSKIRLHSQTQSAPVVKLASRIPGQNGLHFDVVQNSCPESSSEIGWTTCDAEFHAGSHLSTASSVQLFIMFPSNDADDVDIDDLSFTFVSALQSGGIELMNPDFDACYAPGSKVLVPSDDLNYNSEQVLTISDMFAGGVVKVQEEVTRITTYADSSQFATEFAMLSRNIQFKNGDDDSVGPSLVVLHTPNIHQKIEGVELNGFGIESAVGRYPINFKESGDSLASSLSKNTIQNSHNRCINIDKTNNVNIAENVAYNTLGHCYVLSSGDEIGNTFHRNLGAVTKSAIAAAGETDAECSTFYLKNPANTFTENVAAGSEKNGFWFNLSPLASSMDFTEFAGNVVHSSSLFGIKTYPTGLKPENVNTWSNLRIYRNKQHGIIFHLSKNIRVDGGVIADNRIGIDLWLADNMSMSNLEIQGYSQSYKNIADSVIDTPKHCEGVASIPITGIRFHPNANNAGYGTTTVDNVSFSGFAEHCNPSSSAFVFNANLVDPVAYTTSIEMTNSTFDAPSLPKNEISLCAVHNADVRDIFIIDDGGLNPLGGGPGLVVSNDANMTQSGTCSTMSGSCAQYCTGVDMNLFGAVDSPSPEEGGDEFVPAPAPAPLADAPVGESICIVNGDFEDGLTGWDGAHSTVSVVSDGFDGSSKALKTSDRTHSARGGISQTIATSCLTAGAWYEVHAKVMLTQGGSAFECDPSLLYYADNACAGINLLVSGAVKQVGFTVSPLQEGWNTIYGVFKATDEIMSVSSINVVVARPATSVDITVDNVVLSAATANSAGVTDCSSPISNGDAEIGDAREWFIRGHGGNGAIQIVSPGYNGSSKAFKHVGERSERVFSMVQIVDGACFSEGSSWTISAQFRYLDNAGAFVACDKTTRFAADSCPVFAFYAGNMVTTGALPNIDNAPMTIGGWNRIENTFTVSADMAGHDEMWVNVFAIAGTNYEIDDIVLVPN